MQSITVSTRLRSADRRGIGQGPDDVFNGVDNEGVMVAIQFNDGRLADAVRAIRFPKLQRPHAIDDGQHPATQRGEASHMGGGAWHRNQGVQLDDGLNRSGWESDALASDGHDQQKLVHLPLPALAVFKAMSRPARS